MNYSAISSIIMTAFLMLAGQASATPGGVDSQGCHGSKKMGQHCHPGRAQSGGAADGSRADRDKRLKRECKGQANAGACLGYTR